MHFVGRRFLMSCRKREICIFSPENAFRRQTLLDVLPRGRKPIYFPRKIHFVGRRFSMSQADVKTTNSKYYRTNNNNKPCKLYNRFLISSSKLVMVIISHISGLIERLIKLIYKYMPHLKCI